MRAGFALIAMGPALLLAACATDRAPPPHVTSTPAAWDNGAAGAADAAVVDQHWWTRLGDPAVDELVSAAMAGNPTLDQALARLDQARSVRAASKAAYLPRLEVSATASRGRQMLTSGSSLQAVTANSASISPSLGWELDLWGRLRRATDAAQMRIDARTADAQGARLLVSADLASGVIRLRACNASVVARERDITSRSTELELMQARLSLGAAAPADIAQAVSNLASAKTERISQEEQCARELDALVALSGVDPGQVRKLLASPASGAATTPAVDGLASEPAGILPTPPPMRPALPATLLLAHPSVLAADREAAARWAEIDVAQAERLPRVSIAGVLTGQWLDALGATSHQTTWSIGPQLSGVLFDGGAGSANVRNAKARYRESVAALEIEVRAAIQDVEDGLAAQQSAAARLQTSREALQAARVALEAAAARRRLGAVSQFELEDTRRQFNRAQDNAIAAARDHALAWVALVRACGGAFETPGPAAASSTPPASSLLLANRSR